MATAVWSGTITFGLVSIPVKLYTATTSHNISFHLLHRKCKSRINLQNYCSTCDQVVQRADLVKGYEYEKNQYVIIEEEDLQSIQPESSTIMDISQFVDLKEIDPIYYERTYYLGPDKGNEKTFALLATAMQQTGKAAIGKLTMRNHEYLALVRPGMNGLMVHFMLYADEIRQNEFQISGDFEPRPKELELAKQLIENLSEPFKPEAFQDDYIKRLEELIESRLQGRKLTIITPKERPKVVDLMEALQKSIEQTRKKPAARAAVQTRASRARKAR